MFLNENDKSEFVEDRYENTVFDWLYNGCWQKNNQPTVEKRLAQQCFLDGDWCWDTDPFQVTEETKEMVMHNICFLLNNFLRCTAYDNIILCWVMHNGGNENGHYYRVTINPIIYDNVSERINATTISHIAQYWQTPRYEKSHLGVLMISPSRNSASVIPHVYCQNNTACPFWRIRKSLRGSGSPHTPVPAW